MSAALPFTAVLTALKLALTSAALAVVFALNVLGMVTLPAVSSALAATRPIRLFREKVFMMYSFLFIKSVRGSEALFPLPLIPLHFIPFGTDGGVVVITSASAAACTQYHRYDSDDEVHPYVVSFHVTSLLWSICIVTFYCDARVTQEKNLQIMCDFGVLMGQTSQ
jgi:hypothetical protein